MDRLLRAIPLMLAALVGADGPTRAADETFIIVIRTGADQTLAQMSEVVDATLRKLGNGDILKVVKKAPDVQALTPAEYGAYARIENPRAIAPKMTAVKKDRYEFVQVDGAVPTWQLQLKGSPIPTLNEMTVTFAGAKNAAETLKPGKGDDPLRAVLPGTYLLRLADRTKTPTGFTMKTQDVGGGAVADTVGEWPTGDNFYLIRLEGFTAALRQQFEETIKSPKIPNALETFAVKKGVTLAIAEGNATDDEQVALRLDKNRLYLSVPRLRQKEALRAWVLFPLPSADAAKAAVAEFKGLTGRQVGDKIRNAKPLMATDPVVLMAGEKGVPPRWIELPWVPDGLLVDDPRLPLARNAYGRVVRLIASDAEKATPAELRKLATALPALHAAVVYEFDDGTNRSAQSYKRQPTSPRQFVNEFDFPEWPQLVKPLLSLPPDR